MLKTLMLATALIASTAASALPFQTSDRFFHDKSGYLVTVHSVDSRMRLKGRHPETGQTFDVAVSRSGKVKGTYEGKPIAFVMGASSNTEQLATAHKALNAAQ